MAGSRAILPLSSKSSGALLLVSRSFRLLLLLLPPPSLPLGPQPPARKRSLRPRRWRHRPSAPRPPVSPLRCSPPLRGGAPWGSRRLSGRCGGGGAGGVAAVQEGKKKKTPRIGMGCWRGEREENPKDDDEDVKSKFEITSFNVTARLRWVRMCMLLGAKGPFPSPRSFVTSPLLTLPKFLHTLSELFVGIGKSCIPFPDRFLLLPQLIDPPIDLAEGLSLRRSRSLAPHLRLQHVPSSFFPQQGRSSHRRCCPFSRGKDLHFI